MPVRMLVNGVAGGAMDGLRLGLENPDEFWPNFGWGAGTGFLFNSLTPGYTAPWPNTPRGEPLRTAEYPAIGSARHEPSAE